MVPNSYYHSADTSPGALNSSRRPVTRLLVFTLPVLLSWGLVNDISAAPEAAGQFLRVQDNRLSISAKTFSAEFDGARLVSLKSKEGQVEFLRQDDSVFPLEMVYATSDRLREDKGQRVEVRLISPRAARILMLGNDSDREMLVRLDEETGDLCVTPSGRGARRGVLAARWNLPFTREAALVLPCVNGMLVESNRAFPGNDRFTWPFRWNAQLAIAQREGAALMVHSEDTDCKFKALNLARKDGVTTLGFDSEQPGPIWDNRGAGGIEWRINVYAGDWHAPAQHYRDWLRQAYALEKKRSARPAWVQQVDFAFQWSNADLRLLEALAKLHAPQRTLIHLSDWRTSKYDIDYPDYKASDAAREFMAKANAAGFKVMPHFNFFACYNKHPRFIEFRDWQVRNVNKNEPEGWYWPSDTHQYTRMAYIHPGLGSWRRTLMDAVLNATTELKAPVAFLDQTLCTWNTDNGLVENSTTVEGLRQMQEEFSRVSPELVLAGEGANEISIQRQAFAQAHIHDGWGSLRPDHVAAAHPICAFLWEGHLKLVGYYHLGPNDKDSEIGVEVYRKMGALPTLVCNDPSKLTLQEPLVKRIIGLIAPQ